MKSDIKSAPRPKGTIFDNVQWFFSRIWAEECLSVRFQQAEEDGNFGSALMLESKSYYQRFPVPPQGVLFLTLLQSESIK